MVIDGARDTENIRKRSRRSHVAEYFDYSKHSEFNPNLSNGDMDKHDMVSRGEIQRKQYRKNVDEILQKIVALRHKHVKSVSLRYLYI